MFAEMAHIFQGVLLPVLVIIGIGMIVQRFYPLHMPTLTRLNLYLFVPAFLFVSIRASELSWANVGVIAVAVFLPMGIIGLPLYMLLRKRQTSGSTKATVIVSGLFYNAGNFGIPVAVLAFGQAGAQVQALVVMFMNTCIFFLGYGILSLGHGGGLRAMLGYFKLPMIYVVVAALAMRDADIHLPVWAMVSLETIAAGMVPIALVTLAAQLASRARWPRWRVITPVMVIKLLLIPAVTGLVVWLMGLWPWPGAQLVLAASGPTAVNTLLLTLEMDGDADAAADCVFWTTLASAVSVTLVLTAILALGGGPP